jgi:hypothetical protein
MGRQDARPIFQTPTTRLSRCNRPAWDRCFFQLNYRRNQNCVISKQRDSQVSHSETDDVLFGSDLSWLVGFQRILALGWDFL